MTFISDIPRLMEDWDWEKNELKPDEVTHGSNKKVWWVCKVEDCRHSWKTGVYHRTKKIKPTSCPACINSVVTCRNNLFIKFPEVSEEWHPTRNGDLSPECVVYGSTKKVWWLCPIQECEHVWRVSVCKRTGKVSTGCPACSGNVVTDKNNLKVNFPKLSEEWHPTKNGSLSSENVLPGSHKKVFWCCSKDFNG